MMILSDASPDFFNSVLWVAIIIVAILLLIVSLISGVISIVLAISYIKYNHTKNSLDMNGKDLARKMLDENGLENIKVKVTGSILYGNSYSHFFKKIRLRRLTYKKKSIASLAMAGEKVCLAIMDRDNDPDMKKRIKIFPIITFGPFLCVPLIAVGALIDYFIFKTDSATMTIVASCIGIVFYLLSFILSFMTLKTEKKAQDMSIEMMLNKNYINDEEAESIRKLFKLYNIEYINNMVLAMLELIYRVLRLVLMFTNNSGSSTSSSSS